MRQLRVAYRESATHDLQDIYSYIRQGGAGPVDARAYIGRIRATCRKIGDAPEGGRSRPDLAAGLRVWTFEGRAVIAYTVEPGRVLIQNILYGGRDIDAFYAGGRVVPEASP